MDNLNFFFGLKATRSSNLTEIPITGTAIIYMSKHGTTEKLALLIKELLMDEEITLINLDKHETIDLLFCDRVIIGSSIHMGQVEKQIYNFCRQHADILKSKKLGLFLCCMYEGKKSPEQFNHAFPKDILAASKSKALMSYELYFEQMNLIERTMTKKMTGQSDEISHINQLEINQFIEELR